MITLLKAFVAAAEANGLDYETAVTKANACAQLRGLDGEHATSIAKACGAECAAIELDAVSPDDKWVTVCHRHKHRHGTLRKHWQEIWPSAPRCGCQIRYAKTGARKSASRMERMESRLLELVKSFEESKHPRDSHGRFGDSELFGNAAHKADVERDIQQDLAELTNWKKSLEKDGDQWLWTISDQDDNVIRDGFAPTRDDAVSDGEKAFGEERDAIHAELRAESDKREANYDAVYKAAIELGAEDGEAAELAERVEGSRKMLSAFKKSGAEFLSKYVSKSHVAIEKRYVSEASLKGGWEKATPPDGMPASKPGKGKSKLWWAKPRRKKPETAKPIHEKTLDEHTADKRKDWETANAKRTMTPEEKRKALLGVDVNAAAEHRKAVASAKRKGVAVRDDVAASVKAVPPKPKSEKIEEPNAQLRGEGAPPPAEPAAHEAHEKPKKVFTKNVRIEASGNTFAVKDSLRDRKWEWDKKKKVWFKELVPAHAERVANGDAEFLKGLGGNLKGVVLHLDGDEVWRSKTAQSSGASPSTAVDDLLAKHGRTLRGDGKPATYITSSGKGGGLSVGDIVSYNNKDGSTTHRMVIRADKPHYVSSDHIEDMDAWSTYKDGRGWYQSYVSVPVEANEKEAKASAEKVAAKAREERKYSLVQSIRVPENHSETGSISGMTELWENRMAGSGALYTDGIKLTYVSSSYDDGPNYWTTSDKAIVDEAISLSGKSIPKPDDGPKDGDRNADGLVFRNGRWHRDETEVKDEQQRRGRTDGHEGTAGTAGGGEPDGRGLTGSGGDSGLAGRAGDSSFRPRVVNARKDITPPHNPTLVPADLQQFLIDDTGSDHQIVSASLAISAMSQEDGKHRGFLLSDGTGTGKTRAMLAVAKAFIDKGKRVLIVAPKAVLDPIEKSVKGPDGKSTKMWVGAGTKGSWSADSKTMGLDGLLSVAKDGVVKAGAINMTTYDHIKAYTGAVDKNTVVLFDEADNLKGFRGYIDNDGALKASSSTSAVGKHGQTIAAKCGGVMYATATPTDKVADTLNYLQAVGVFGVDGMSKTKEKLGYILEEQHIGRGEYVKTWKIDPDVGAKEVMRRTTGLFDQLVRDGQMVRHELSRDGIEVDTHSVDVDASTLADVKSTYESTMRETGMRAQALLKARYALEVAKVPATADAVQKTLGEGRSAVVFVARVSESKDGLNPTAQVLHAELLGRGIDPSRIVQFHGESKDKRPIEQFQSNDAHVIITTIESGGVGINLDDRTGDRPRDAYFMALPFSASKASQGDGRVCRRSSKTAARIKFVVANSEYDEWNMGILRKKYADLGAIVKGGQVSSGVAALSDEDAEILGEDHDPTPYVWGKSLRDTRHYAKTPFDHKPLLKKYGARNVKINDEWVTEFPSVEEHARYKADVAAKDAAAARRTESIASTSPRTGSERGHSGSWHKLRDGSWGGKISASSKPAVGDTVKLKNAKGETKVMTVKRIVAKFDDNHLVEFA